MNDFPLETSVGIGLVIVAAIALCICLLRRGRDDSTEDDLGYLENIYSEIEE